LELRSSGDLLLTGKLYPGNRGQAQDDAYIYYDAAGGGYMRTNAAGWSVGSYDFAETYASADALVAGEVVEFGVEAGTVRRSVGEEYSDRIVGIVSTRPGFLAGELIEGNFPIALSGRVPALVSTANGAVAIGDPLTTSSAPGVLMKATQPGPVVGYALEELSADTGSISVFVRATYFDGATPVAAEGVGSTTNLDQLQLSGNLLLSGGAIRGIGRLEGIGGAWSLAEDGTLRTGGRVEQVTRGHNGDLVATTVPGTFGRTVTYSGTAVLENGRATVRFPQEYLEIVSPALSPRIIATPYALLSGVAVIERSPTGFVLASGGGESGISIDWYVVAPHKDDEQSWMTGDDQEEVPVVVAPEPEPEPGPEIELEPGPEPSPEEIVAPEETVVAEGGLVEEPVEEPVVLE
jgi:hypothetical protein